MTKRENNLAELVKALSFLVDYYEDEMDRQSFDDESVPKELLELEAKVDEAQAKVWQI